MLEMSIFCLELSDFFELWLAASHSSAKLFNVILLLHLGGILKRARWLFMCSGGTEKRRCFQRARANRGVGKIHCTGEIFLSIDDIVIAKKDMWLKLLE